MCHSPTGFVLYTFNHECAQYMNLLLEKKASVNGRHSSYWMVILMLFPGMMSSSKYLSSRVQRNVDTWAQKGGWRIDVFTDPGPSHLQVPEGLNINIVTYDHCWHYILGFIFHISTRLPGVDDTAYPPQKKCFMLLRHMHDYHINDYDWFIRADDDSYTDFPRLEKLLNKLNSSLPIFLGSPGFGVDEDDGIEEGECSQLFQYHYSLNKGVFSVFILVILKITHQVNYNYVESIIYKSTITIPLCRLSSGRY